MIKGALRKRMVKACIKKHIQGDTFDTENIIWLNVHIQKKKQKQNLSSHYISLCYPFLL